MSNFLKETYPGLTVMLAEHLALAGNYYELTRMQARLIEEGDVYAVAEAIAERGKLIERIDEHNRALLEPMKEYAAFKRGLSGDEPRISEAESSIAGAREMFLSSQRLDAENMEALRSLMGKTADEGKKLSKSREGIGKYSQKDLIFPPGLFDQKQ